MQSLLRREYDFLRRPLTLGARVLLLLGIAALIAAIILPLWKITLIAPQYQEGLTLQIYSYQLVAGNGGQDLVEINGLNHYIGMKPLEQAALFAIYFLPPAVLLLLAGLSFLVIRRRGWLLASTAQSLILLACLFAYSDPRPAFAYPFIAYCILMVLYLNSRNVRAAFHSKEKPASSRSGTVYEA